MREVISLSLPEGSVKKLRRIAKSKDLTLSEILRDALRKYIVLDEFSSIRRKMLKQVEKTGKGPYTDEDIFKIVS